MTIDINEADVDGLKSLEYISPTISDKEKDKPIIRTSGSYEDAPCKCITVSTAPDSFTVSVDQSKLTPYDTGKYSMKVTLEDKHFSETKKKTEKTMKIDIKVAEKVVEEVKNETESETNKTESASDKDEDKKKKDLADDDEEEETPPPPASADDAIA